MQASKVQVRDSHIIGRAGTSRTTARIFLYNFISFDLVSGYRKCFYVLLFHRHISTYHGRNTCRVDRGSVAGSQASQNDRESVVLLKLLNTISVAPSNVQLDMLSSKC